MKRGDIVLINLPRPDPANPSHEQAGRRPAVVVQVDSAIPSLKTVVVIPLTARLKAKRFPGSVPIAPTVLNCLDHPSVALTHQILTVDKRKFGDVVGELDEADMEKVETALAGFLGLQRARAE